MRRAGRTVRGSVSVYLALVFILVLSLVMACLEAAAAACLRSSAEAALASGAESALADYYYPLFEKYGIFALDLGYGEKLPDREELERRVARITEANSSGNLLVSCEVTATDPITAAGGKAFIRQAVEAEEITLAEEGIEALAQKLGLLTSVEKEKELFARKTELEQECASLDIYTLELMGIIDGVYVDAGQLLAGVGGYTIKDAFVKRFMVRSIDSTAVGINNQSIYMRLKDRYVDPVGRLTELADTADEYGGLVAEADRIYAEADPLREELGELNRQIDELLAAIEEKKRQEQDSGNADEGEPGDDTEVPEEEDEDTVLLRSLQDEAGQIASEIRAIESRYREVKKAADEKGRICAAAAADLKKLCEETASELEAARTTAAEAVAVCGGLAPKIEEFEGLLDAETGIDEDLRAEMEASLAEMKAYAGITDDTDVTDFALIGLTALADRQLLADSRAEYILVPPACDQQAIAAWSGELRHLAEVLGAFSYEGMVFDYTEFDAREPEEFAVDAVSSYFLEPASRVWLKLVLGEDADISDASLDSFLLPKTEGEEDRDKGLFSFSGLFGKGGDDTESSAYTTLCGIMKNGLVSAYDKAMLDMYLHDHFNDFSDDTRMDATILSYEQEYILCGSSIDRVNLAGALAQIMLIRMVPAGIYVYTDSGTNAQAALTAQMTVGFTGLPFLTLLVKYLILTVWALEQAVIETAAIARGKKVPIMTSAASFCVGYTEILAFSPAMVSLKADSFYEGGVSLDYSEYLWLLLLAKNNATIAGRALDLIQENLRYAYGDNFLIANCVTGITAKARIDRDASYTRIFAGLSDGAPAGYSVRVQCRKTYCAD